jgi:hypothetical protein
VLKKEIEQWPPNLTEKEKAAFIMDRIQYYGDCREKDKWEEIAIKKAAD